MAPAVAGCRSGWVIGRTPRPRCDRDKATCRGTEPPGEQPLPGHPRRSTIAKLDPTGLGLAPVVPNARLMPRWDVSSPEGVVLEKIRGTVRLGRLGAHLEDLRGGRACRRVRRLRGLQIAVHGDLLQEYIRK